MLGGERRRYWNDRLYLGSVDVFLIQEASWNLEMACLTKRSSSRAPRLAIQRSSKLETHKDHKTLRLSSLMILLQRNIRQQSWYLQKWTGHSNRLGCPKDCLRMRKTRLFVRERSVWSDVASTLLVWLLRTRSSRFSVHIEYTLVDAHHTSSSRSKSDDTWTGLYQVYLKFAEYIY